MINPKTYYRPRSLEEALNYTNEPGSIAIAGGGLLLGGVTLPYESVVDLQDLSELKQIRQSDDGWWIGGAAVLEAVVQQRELPAQMRSAITRTMPLNLRSNVSAAESLVAPQPRDEWLAALAALDAQVEHVGFRKGQLSEQTQRHPVLDFVSAVREHGYPYGGLVIGLHIGAINGLLGTAFVARTPADLPIVSAAAHVELDADQRVTAARLIVTGASEAPAVLIAADSLMGQVLDDETIAAFVRTVPQQVSPVADYRGSVDYRRQMAAVMVKRALQDRQQQ